MPLRVIRTLDEVSIRILNFSHTARPVTNGWDGAWNITKGGWQDLFVAFNQQNHPDAGRVPSRHRSVIFLGWSLTRIRNGIEICPHPCAIKWPAFGDTKARTIQNIIERPRYRNHFALAWCKKRRESMRVHTLLRRISIFISVLRASIGLLTFN